MRVYSSGLMFVGLAVCASASAQHQEGLVPTQALVAVESRSAAPTTATDVAVMVDGHKVPLNSWAPVTPGTTQMALLIDDGLRESVGRNLSAIKAFLTGLPPGVEVLVGYMQNGRIVQAQPFTRDHAAAAAAVRLPQGSPGESASPYFCLSDFVKHWPGHVDVDPNAAPEIQREPTNAKARFVLMITNGVDPYNGSTSITNQDSPYVSAATTDAKRAGVSVYSIYYGGAGIGGDSASFSGQSYLEQVTQGTGGRNYYEGTGNPVSFDPFLKKFSQALASTYVAGFEVPARRNGRELVRLKVTSPSKVKLRSADEIRPGNQE